MIQISLDQIRQSVQEVEQVFLSTEPVPQSNDVGKLSVAFTTWRNTGLHFPIQLDAPGIPSESFPSVDQLFAELQQFACIHYQHLIHSQIESYLIAGSVLRILGINYSFSIADKNWANCRFAIPLASVRFRIVESTVDLLDNFGVELAPDQTLDYVI